MSMIRYLAFLLLLVPFPLSAQISVEDETGRTLVLAQPARRIVSLAPHVTEQLYAIGAGEQLVGAVEFSDYPEAARALPRVGGFSRIDPEAVLALRPDLVVGWASGNDPRELERLEQLGITVYRSDPHRLVDVAEGMRRLGVLSGQVARANAAAEKFMRTLQRLERVNQGRPRLRVFYQIWDHPLMSVNGEHLISDVIRLCGGENVFADLPALTPTVSVEAVLAANPDLIVASGMGDARPDWLDAWRRWERLGAVRNERLFFIPPDLLQRATPRLLLGAEQVCGLVHAAHLQQQH